VCIFGRFHSEFSCSNVKKQSRQSLIHQASQRAGFSLSNFICFSCLWLNFLSHEGKGCGSGLLFGLFFAFSHANRHGIGI